MTSGIEKNEKLCDIIVINGMPSHGNEHYRIPVKKSDPIEIGTSYSNEHEYVDKRIDDHSGEVDNRFTTKLLNSILEIANVDITAKMIVAIVLIGIVGAAISTYIDCRNRNKSRIAQQYQILTTEQSTTTTFERQQNGKE